MLLPIKEEIISLLAEYLNWYNSKLEELMRSEFNEKTLKAILALSCDAHNRIVHIHPFSDGNGRVGLIKLKIIFF